MGLIVGLMPRQSRRSYLITSVVLCAAFVAAGDRYEGLDMLKL